MRAPVASVPLKIQVLMSPGCSHGKRARQLVEDVARKIAPGAEVEEVVVATLQDAARWSFPGSPTIRVNGLDIDPAPPANVGLG